MKRREEKRSLTPCQQKIFIIDDVQFSNREMNVLAYVCSGYTVKYTAGLLKLSFRTAKFHFNNIKEKANCHSKTDIIKRFTKNHADHLIIKERLDSQLVENFKYLYEPSETMLCYSEAQYCLWCDYNCLGYFDIFSTSK